MSGQAIRCCGYGGDDGRDDAPVRWSAAWCREHKAAHLAFAPHSDAITIRNLDDEIADAERTERAA